MSAAWPWAGPAARFLGSGRQALAWLVAAALPRGARVLCPACICASVPAGIAAGGAATVYYGQDEALQPHWAELAAREGEALLLVHPLGRLLPAGPVRALKASRPDLLIIEDLSHTLLAKAPALGIDVGFASLRKLLPVPDGGVVLAWHGRPLPPGPRPSPVPSAFVRSRLAGDPAAEEELDRWAGSPQPVWRDTLQRLDRLDPAALRRARRARYRHLERSLGSPDARPFWPTLPPDVGPLALPLRCRNRHDLRRRLQRTGIAAEPYWPVPEAAWAAAGLAGRMLAGTLLLVSCDPGSGRPARARHRTPAAAGEAATPTTAALPA